MPSEHLVVDPLDQDRLPLAQDLGVFVEALDVLGAAAVAQPPLGEHAPAVIRLDGDASVAPLLRVGPELLSNQRRQLGAWTRGSCSKVAATGPLEPVDFVAASCADADCAGSCSTLRMSLRLVPPDSRADSAGDGVSPKKIATTRISAKPVTA